MSNRYLYELHNIMFSSHHILSEKKFLEKKAKRSYK